jgi:hypothetical protein
MFFIGSIYNLTYEEVMINGTLVKFHNFSCSRVIMFLKQKGFPIIIPFRVKTDERYFISEHSDNRGKTYFRGYIGENFLFVLWVVEIY